MGLSDFWKRPSPEKPDPLRPASREELERVFGVTGLAALRKEVRVPLVVRRRGPFYWAGLTDDRWWFGWVIVDGRAVLLGSPTVLPTLIAQSITEPMEVTERVAVACDIARVTIVETIEQLDLRTAPALRQEAVRAKFEPPHGEGSRWVCCVHDYSATWKHEPAVYLYRLSVDADSLRVDLEVLGQLCEDRTGIRGPAHVDDNGAFVVADVNRVDVDADASSLWLDQALTEHAGIAAFARLTLELMALGAPLALIGRVQQAALDEVRHAEQCLTLARADGVDVTLGALPALPPRSGDRAALARRVHDEMVVNEAAAVDEFRARAAVCVDDDVRAILLQQADDEQRHVELARDTVAWALSATG